MLPAFLSAVPLPSTPARTRSPCICMCDEPDKKPDTEAAKPNKPGPPKKGPRKIIRSTATWANVFLPDFGRKGPGSVPDFDLRPTSVKSEQEKTGICSSCKGTGIMRCTFCLGTEFIKENGEAERCPACDGKVDVTCGVCFGAKKEIELSGEWWKRGVAAFFKD